MKKIRILQTPVRFYPYTGGVEKYVLNLSQELIKRGHSVKVVCADEPKSDLTEIDGINVRRLNYIGKISNTNITLGLFFALLKENFDIIHTHFPSPWSADISMIISFLKRKPLILTYHNDAVTAGKMGVLTEVYNRVFLKLLLKGSAKILVTQPEYINRSKYLYKYKNKIEVIPNGIDTKIYFQKNINKIPNQIFFLSILDRHHTYKGLDCLIKAIKIVRTKIPDIRLIVGGSGDMVKNYKFLAKKLELEKNIEFRGFIESNKLVDLYNQSELFVLPSTGIQEGFGIVLLEALACGTPVIATNIVGIAKEIKDNKCGIIIPCNDAKKLAQAIIRIIKNINLQKKMIIKGKLLIQDKYDWNKIVKMVENIYLRVIR
jgi:glycosyltransferase involved in cell wall biosynthesis